MQLVGDSVATNEGVDNLMGCLLDARRHVKVVALGDGVRHRQHKVESVGLLYSEEGWSARRLS
jgi:hypothetical protein